MLNNTLADRSALHANERAYARDGLGAQRRFPNEEFCRFMGRRYFAIPMQARSKVRFLELGCGTAANLWMVAREGYDAWGIDFSQSGLMLARQMLADYGTTARLTAADMTALPFADRQFDCVFDVYSSYCMDEKGFDRVIAETARVLAPQGRFFIYTPGKNSDAWRNYAPATRIDASTLSGIARPGSPYFPAPHPFRFITHGELADVLARHGLAVEAAETVTRTYGAGAEVFEFIVAEARLPPRTAS